MTAMEARRRLLMMADELPGIYRRVEYLQSTGRQYIDTLVDLGSDNFSVEVDFVKNQWTSGEQAVISNWITQSNYWNCFLGAGTPDAGYLTVYTAGHHRAMTTIYIGTKYHAKIHRSDNNWMLLLNDESLEWSYTPGAVNNTTVKIFTRGDVPAESSSNTHINLYSAKIAVAGEVKRKYIPCVRKADGKPGLYDTITKTFFVNASSKEPDFIVPTA